MTTNPGLSWASPFTSVTVLDLLPHGASGAAVCTDDGTKLYGRDDDPTLLRAVSWPGPPGVAATLMDDPDLSARAWATCSTPDGSVQVGLSGFNDSVYWTTGGTAVTFLAPFAGFTSYRASLEQQRAISDDGTIIIGFSGGVLNAGSQATQWTNGTPSLLANPTFGGGNTVQRTFARGCDGSGTIIVGGAQFMTGALFSGTVALALYWDSGTAFVLVGYLSTSLEALAATATRCLADGSLIYGECNPSATGITPDAIAPCYWNSLATIDPTSGAAGIIHFLDFLPGGTTATVTYCAEVLVGGDPIAVGHGDTGVGDVWAIKWTDTAAVNLGSLPGGHTSTANACSADGSVVVGTSDDADFITWPVYWDASNVIHKLPTVADTLDPFQGEALGVSRDGLVIFGDGNSAGGGPIIRASMADMFFSPTQDFVDFSVAANRRKFISADGCTVNPGANGTTPFGDVPPVFLTIPSSAGSANTFASNFGDGGAFVLSGGNLTFSATQPCCDTTTIVIPGDAEGVDDPQIMLSVSDDGGRTWSVLQKWRSMGKIGEYLKRLRWLKMGQFRQRIIKLEVTDPVRRNINGFYIDTTEGME